MELDHLARNLEQWQKTPLRGFVVLGPNGEAVLLTTEERLDAWKTAGEAIAPSHLFIPGTGCEATGETLALAEKAAFLGALALAAMVTD